MNPGWYYTLGDIESFCMGTEDTIIKSETYSTLKKCPSNDYHGAIRDNGGQVFFVPKDSLQAYLLYDFTLSVGDTVYDYFEEGDLPGWGPSFTTTTINQIDSIQLSTGEYRRAIRLNNGLHWIEGIGATTGLLKGDGANISNYFLHLECMSHIDTNYLCGNPFNVQGPEYFCGPTPHQACHITSLYLDEHTTRLARTYPNPASNVVNVESPLGGEVRVIGLNGVIALTTTLPSGVTSIDVSDLSPGLYVIQIKHEFGWNYLDRFVKR